MPMKAAVREMLPEKRSICALRYSRSNTSRASRSGSAIIRSAPRLVAWSVTMASAGSMLAVIGSDGAPEARISILSTLLRSWRRFPGHARTCNVARASSANRRFGMPVASLIRSMKYSTNSGMSSRRSESPGTFTGTTFSRWNRSSRNRPAAISSRKSREVEETTRTSTCTSLSPPTLRKLWSTSTRRIRPWVSRGMSATSSR